MNTWRRFIRTAPNRTSSCWCKRDRGWSEFFFDQGKATVAGVEGTLWPGSMASRNGLITARPGRTQNQRLNSAWFGESARVKSRAYAWPWIKWRVELIVLQHLLRHSSGMPGVVGGIVLRSFVRFSLAISVPHRIIIPGGIIRMFGDSFCGGKSPMPSSFRPRLLDSASPVDGMMMAARRPPTPR